jgi:amino acid transporter
MTDTIRATEATTRLFQVLTFWDLVVYGLVYVSPIGPWSSWGFVNDLSGGVTALAYALGALGMSFTAFSYSAMCREVPDAGSVYAYARFAMGETVGFVAGWLVLLDYLLLPALMYVFCGVGLSSIIPKVSSWVWVLMVAAYNLGVNWYGVRTSARFNIATLLFQSVILAAFLSAALLAMHRLSMPMFTRDQWWRPHTAVTGVLSAASLCVLAFLGFDAITTLSAEVRPPQRHLIGKAVIFCIGLLGVVTVVDVWIIGDLARGFRFASDLTTAPFDLIGARVDPLFAQVVTWASVVAVAISISPPMVSAVARVLYSMAEKGEMPRPLATLNAQYGVPRNALLVSAALSIAVALIFTRHFDTLTSMVNFGALGAFALVNASVIALFSIKRRSNRFFVHLIMPLLGVTTIGAVMTQMNWIGLSVGMTWLICGLSVALVLRRRSRSVRTQK